MELVAVLPLVAVVGALLWQAVLAGQAIWLVGAAARAAARAHAVGGDARAAARALLPDRLKHGLRAVTGTGGAVAVSIVVPLVTGGRLTTVTARAAFTPQSR